MNDIMKKHILEVEGGQQYIVRCLDEIKSKQESKLMELTLEYYHILYSELSQARHVLINERMRKELQLRQVNYSHFFFSRKTFHKLQQYNPMHANRKKFCIV
jgi:predicted transcriptional regulator of viral defense system